MIRITANDEAKKAALVAAIAMGVDAKTGVSYALLNNWNNGDATLPSVIFKDLGEGSSKSRRIFKIVYPQVVDANVLGDARDEVERHYEVHKNQLTGLGIKTDDIIIVSASAKHGHEDFLTTLTNATKAN